jgi:cytochrome c5
MLLAAHFLALPCGAESPSYKSETRVYNLAHGRVVFTNKCMRCHEGGRKGAPVFGDAADWAERLEQPLNTMIGHAINGHGRMPARGDQDISDQDVAAAVAYVVDRTRLLVAEELKELPPAAAGTSAEKADGLSDQAVVQMFLMLLHEKNRWR